MANKRCWRRRTDALTQSGCRGGIRYEFGENIVDVLQKCQPRLKRHRWGGRLLQIIMHVASSLSRWCRWECLSRLYRASEKITENPNIRTTKTSVPLQTGERQTDSDRQRSEKERHQVLQSIKRLRRTNVKVLESQVWGRCFVLGSQFSAPADDEFDWIGSRMRTCLQTKSRVGQ